MSPFVRPSVPRSALAALSYERMAELQIIMPIQGMDISVDLRLLSPFFREVDQYFSAIVITYALQLFLRLHYR